MIHLRPVAGLLECEMRGRQEPRGEYTVTIFSNLPDGVGGKSRFSKGLPDFWEGL